MASQPTTPRRSKRFQPIVEFIGPNATEQTTVQWPEQPIHTRTTEPIDLYDEDEVESFEESVTRFYDSFSRTSSVPSSSKRRKPVQDVDDNTFRVGDTVLVKSQAKAPSIAVIVAMWEVQTKDEDDEDSVLQKVKVHWFLRGSELPNVRAKKEKHVQNEIFYSLAGTAILTPQYIIQHCQVSSSKSAINDKPRPARIADSSVVSFYCHLAIDARRGLHYEINWEDHHKHALEVQNDYLGESWDVCPQVDKKSRRKRRRASPESDESGDSSTEYIDTREKDGNEESESEDSDLGEVEIESDPEPSSGDEERAAPRTPSKKRKQNTQSTPRLPRRVRQTVAAPTPHSKAALRVRAKRAKLKILPAPPPELALDVQQLNLPKDPWLRAMQVLHVGSRPDVLPCREEEFTRILGAVYSLLDEGSGGCIYISGVPGTGKTATVHRVIRELKRMAEHNEANPFTYVEINGLKIPEPSAAYSLLWEAVSGHDVESEGHLKVSSKEALKQLTKHFSAGVRAGPGGHACVVLMDELDQLVTTKQDVVYNFFNWPTLIRSKLIVVAVANTMDLPERVMTGRVRSRLGMIRINFQPYTTPQLEKIVQSRLLSAKDPDVPTSPAVIAPDGVKFAAMKVSSVSGDARRVLDVCRRAVELVQPHQRPARTEDIKNVIKMMENSPTAAWLRDCSLHERIMLAALVKCVKREGVDEVKWGDIQHQHLLYTNILTGDGDSTRKPSIVELRRVLDSLLASHAVLFEDSNGHSRKSENERHILLNIEQGEVERVLGDLGGQRWKNALGV